MPTIYDHPGRAKLGQPVVAAPQQYVDRKGRYNLPAFRNRFVAAMDPAQRVAEETEADYLGRARTYDPQASFERTAGAMWGDVREDLGEDLRDLRGASVGAGRLDTGFYDEDQGYLIDKATEEFQRSLAREALGTESLRLRNIEDLGQYAMGASNRYLDLMTGGLDRAEAEEEAKRRKGSFWGRLGRGLAGGIGGFVTGGPAGAAAGAVGGFAS